MAVYWKGGKIWIRWKPAYGGKPISKPTTARTKAEGRRLLLEKKQKVERERLGLDPLPGDPTLTVKDLVDWWLEEKCSKASYDTRKPQLQKHIIDPLGVVPAAMLNVAMLDKRFDEMAKAGASASTINTVRSKLVTIFNKARKAGMWKAVNPAADTETRKGKSHDYILLREDQIEGLVSSVPREWRGVFAVAVYLMLRKGEILGLKKTDVIPESREVRIRRSYDGAPKTDKSKATLPIPEILWPFISYALETSPSVYLFPGKKGKMRTKEADPQKVLRAGLVRMGVIEKYRYVCRRCSGAKRREVLSELLAKGVEEKEAKIRATQAARALDDESPVLTEGRRCPKCTMRLWVVAEAPRMRFHDLRHSTATILLAKGTPMQHVQRILRHANITTTLNTYGHLDSEAVRATLNTVGRRKKVTG